jgi:membrane associated rhomboid family serine protease
VLNTVPAETTEVYSSTRRSDCDERAFMLAAVGIPSTIWFDGSGFALNVASADAATALFHLHSYDAERRASGGPAAPAPAVPPYRAAWVGSAVYVAVLCGVAIAISTGLWPADAFERGALDAAQMHGGQWWRAWTALTLHADAAHLIGNLGAGVWFGTLAARQLGAGSAWLLIVTGAAAVNLFDARFGPSTYRSVGASTAVFTALGLMAAHSWRTRYDLQQRWAQRWSPLIAGAVLLGWFGSTGEGTDLVAHALGFTVGCALGALGAGAAFGRGRVSQSLAGLAALGSLALAWALALTN